MFAFHVVESVTDCDVSHWNALVVGGSEACLTLPTRTRDTRNCVIHVSDRSVAPHGGLKIDMSVRIKTVKTPWTAKGLRIKFVKSL